MRISHSITSSINAVKQVAAGNLNVEIDDRATGRSDEIGVLARSLAGLRDELKYMFRKFDPVSRMIISRDSGLLNEYFSIEKSQLIDLYYFCTMD